ncbi:MAG: LytTR family DNA-binding domain-containing protein [Ferruginibacter sp.]
MKSAPAHSVTRYKDISFFLVLIPLINALNYYLTYSNIQFNGRTLLTFTIDTLQGYAAWWIIRTIIIFLDKKIPYEPKPLKRILLQLLFTSVAALAFIIITTEILNAITKDTPVPGSFYSLDIFIFLIWFFVINAIYTGWHYYHLWTDSEKLRLEEKKIRQDGFVIRQGKQTVSIPLAEVAAVYVEGDYSMLLTASTKKHLVDMSLDKIEKQLPEELFFRVNRQYILHRKMITGFDRVENGKINIIVASPETLPALIPMSRTRVSEFKTWFSQQD